jgi:hypothetical protein
MDRVARAKAAFAGQDPNSVPADPQVDRAQQSIRKIKMNTQRTTGRLSEAVAQALSEAAPAAATETVEASEGSVLADNEPTQTASEDKKPLSPQFAALAKAKRAAQAKEAALQAKEAALAQKEADMTSALGVVERLKSDPLRTLTEHGVTYDQLTESLLNQNQGNAGIDELRAELKALKEGIEKQQADRDTAMESQVVRQLEADMRDMVANGDDFELIRAEGREREVVEVMVRHFKNTGELLDAAKVAQQFESELLKDAMKLAALNKVRKQLQPAQTAPQAPPAPAPEGRSNQKVMRTLTSRDGTTPSMTSRERAIAAFYGKLK